MPIRAGKLNRRITLQTLSATRNGIGQPVQSWSDLATVWAEVVTAGGGEGEGDNQRVARSTKQFRIRYRAGLSPRETRVVFDGETYDISAVDEEGLREGLLLTGEAFEPETGP